MTMNWPRWRRVRQVTQIGFLALYFSLLFTALGFADLFFRLDPLTALGSMLSDRTWIARLGLSLVTLALTIAFGRLWCGWVCPMGTLVEWVAFPSARRRTLALSSRWRAIKNILVLVIFAAALFGNLTLLILDPITLLTRVMTVSVLPGFDYAITSLEHGLYPIGLLSPMIDGIESTLRGTLLPTAQPVFMLNTLIMLVLVGIFALNLYADRFWCRYLCPLGAMLGWVSKISFLRPEIDEACDRCAQCVRVCKMGAVKPKPNYEILPSECSVCLDCLGACPQSKISFHRRRRLDPAREFDPSRRQVLAALGISAVSVVTMRTGDQSKRPNKELLRPPGVRDEAEFLSRCVRCSECMNVCPTTGLQPALFEPGLEGLWTPRLVPRLGRCDYGCNVCGQICPTAAIPSLDLPTKRQAVIGLAVVDHNRCLPWSAGITCIVCEEMCPIPQKAIRLEEATMLNAQGKSLTLQRPVVLQELCIGCGVCEYECPLVGDSAIRVFRRS